MNFIKAIFRIIRHLISLSFLVFVIILMANNYQEMTFNLYPLPFEIETKSFIILIGFFLLGMIFGIASCSGSILKKSWQIFSNRHIIKKLRKKLTKEKKKQEIKED